MSWWKFWYGLRKRVEDLEARVELIENPPTSPPIVITIGDDGPLELT